MRGFSIGILLSMFSYLVYINIETILTSINIWAIIFSLIILALTLYILREKWRLPYGFLEFSVGIFTVFTVFFPSKFNLGSVLFDSVFFVKILGAVYIMVRGIDNMMIAIKDTRIGLMLRNFFALS